LEELLLLAGEFVQPALRALGLGTGDLGVCLDVDDERFTDGGLLGRCKQEGLVLALDLTLDQV
jgi:hypothetical protein